MTDLDVYFSSKDVTTPCSNDKDYGIPGLEDLGHDLADLGDELFPGGEQEALKRLDEHMKRKVIPLCSRLSHLHGSTMWVIDKSPRAPRKLNIKAEKENQCGFLPVACFTRDA